MQQSQCSTASHYVAANIESKDQLVITLYQDRNKAYQWLKCDINGCHIYGGSHSFEFVRPPGMDECAELAAQDMKSFRAFVPCDADVNVALLDECLKHSPVSLEKPQQTPSSNTQNVKIGSTPPPAGDGTKAETPQSVPPPTATNAKPAGPPPASRNSASTNTPTFSYLQTGLGAAATIFLAYKAYKENGKRGDESLRNKETPQLKVRTQGQVVSPGSTKNASGWRPLGYTGAAVAFGAFTAYTIIRP